MATHFSLVAEMEKEEFRILNAIEISMRKFEWVPAGNIVFYTRYDAEEVRHWLDVVHKRDLIIRKSGKVERYVLNSKGYDLLALHALAEKDVVASIGNSLGVGKESDVYQAKSPTDEALALKFHRLGRTSFRDVKRKRDYADNKHHVSWLYLCRLSASREAKHLRMLAGIHASVPEVIESNRHVVVMKRYDGQEIHEFPRLDNPKSIFDQLIDEIKTIYDAGLINADMGEYNIIYTVDGRVLLIDWPQAVPTTHPNANELLLRDLTNVCSFFEKHGVTADPVELLSQITGGTRPR